MPWNPIGQEVTCKLCKRNWTCTADDDYFTLAGQITGPDTGFCFPCLLIADGRSLNEAIVIVVVPADRSLLN